MKETSEQQQSKPLSDLALKVQGLLTRFASGEVEALSFVDWLESYADRAREIITPEKEQAYFLDCPAIDIRREYNRFGTGVSGQRVIDWAHAHNIILPHGQHWWFIRERQAEYVKGEAKSSDLLENPPMTGSIIGVPNSHGYPRITNGIDVYIERFDGSLFLGHRDNLKWDRRPFDPNKAKQVNGSAPKSREATREEFEEVERLFNLLHTTT